MVTKAKPKRKLSQAHRKALSASARKRWAEERKKNGAAAGNPKPRRRRRRNAVDTFLRQLSDDVLIREIMRRGR